MRMMMLRMRYKHNSRNSYKMSDIIATNHTRHQRKKQNARQATVISGLSTIYRNQSTTHLIQTHQQSEPRIFLLDITLDEMNKMYPKIHGIIEKGRLRPKGTEVFFVYKKMEHLIVTEDAVYEIHSSGPDIITLNERIPVDGPVTTFEMNIMHKEDDTTTTTSVPILVDESYYKLSRGDAGDTHANNNNNNNNTSGTHISPNHVIERHVKIVVKTHPKSMNAFVFIMNDTETDVLDFYLTTENGIITTSAIGRNGIRDILTKTCKDDINSFLYHFKICS